MDEPSIDAYLGGLESEDLFRLRDRLGELEASDGWREVLNLVGLQRAQSEAKANIRRAHFRPEGLDGLVRGQAADGFIAGYLKGLEDIGRIVGKVHAVADRVSAVLEEEG